MKTPNMLTRFLAYKTSLVIALLAVIIAALLAACGSVEDSEPVMESSSPANTAITETADDLVVSGEEEQEAPSPEPTETPSPEATTAPSSEEEEEASGEQSFAGKVPAPEFPAGLDWLNTERPLTLAELRGKVVLLDFWTYGCINCIHIIPDLHRLEEKYADELVVIGVHSAKFENEGETDNIRQIILRYELEHPVINDNEFEVWNQYGARAWPTLILIDPDGNVLGYHSGEGIYEPFDQVIAGMITEFDALGRIDRTPLALKLEKENQTESPLLFPGKVLADPVNNRLFIADSNHNRIVISDLNGAVLDVIGDGRARLQDGEFETASFFRPQGLTLADDNTLYVADTENHAIRMVDLVNKQVETVAGTGDQEFIRIPAAPGNATALNSPWDVLYYDGLVYIAMAGNHQVWTYDPVSSFVARFAGSGREELRDGGLSEGGLNQPSGLATDGDKLYIADSEASAIRSADLDPEGQLETIVGTGLFDFGDEDGIEDEVRLQHPLGVVYDSGKLYVADTYNSKIKIVDPENHESATFAGGSESGWRDGTDPLFDEPGGLSLAGEKLYVADTNNHVIRLIDLNTRETTTLVLVDMEGFLTRQPPGEDYNGKVVNLEPQTVAPGAGTVQLEVTIPTGYYVNDLAPFSMNWTSADGLIDFDPETANRSIVEPAFPLAFPANFDRGEDELTGDLVIYYCEEEARSLCLIERVRVMAPVTIADGGSEKLMVSHEIDTPADLPGG